MALEEGDDEGIQWLGDFNAPKIPLLNQSLPKSPGIKIQPPFPRTSPSGSVKSEGLRKTDSAAPMKGADSSDREFIIVLPDEPTVVSATASGSKMQSNETDSAQSAVLGTSVKPSTEESSNAVSSVDDSEVLRIVSRMVEGGVWEGVQFSADSASEFFSDAISRVSTFTDRCAVEKRDDGRTNDDLGDGVNEDEDSFSLSESDGDSEDPYDITEQDIYEEPRKMLENSSDSDKKRLEAMILLSEDLHKRILNAENSISEDELPEDARKALEKQLLMNRARSIRILDEIANFTGLKSDDKEVEFPTFKFRDSGHRYLDRCLQLHVQKLLAQGEIQEAPTGKEEGIFEGPTKLLTPQKVKAIMDSIREVKQKGAPLLHKDSGKELKYAEVYERLHVALRRHREKIYKQVILPKFSYDLDGHDMPSDPTLEAKLQRPENGSAELMAFMLNFSKAALAKGLAIERGENDEDVVEPDFGNDEDENDEVDLTPAKNNHEEMAQNEGTDSTMHVDSAEKSTPIAQLPRSDDPCCSKRRLDFTEEEEEKENDERDLKRARSVSSEDASSVVVPMFDGDEDENPDYDDEIKDLLAEADADDEEQY